MKFLVEILVINTFFVLIVNSLPVNYHDKLIEKDPENETSIDEDSNIRAINSDNLVTDKDYKNRILVRRKRFTLLAPKWPTTNLTYRLVLDDNKFVNDKHNIQKILRNAFNVWQKDNILKFMEIFKGTADIMIYFGTPNFTGFDLKKFEKSPFGLAFAPGKGLGGDIYFNKDRHWDFTIHLNNKHGDNVCFFVGALHMIGHSLGLGPSPDHSSIMYERISQDFTTLSQDDLDAIRYIYESKKHKEPTRTFTNSLETHDKKDSKDYRPKDFAIIDNQPELEEDKEENVPSTGFSTNKSFITIVIFLFNLMILLSNI